MPNRAAKRKIRVTAATGAPLSRPDISERVVSRHLQIEPRDTGRIGLRSRRRRRSACRDRDPPSTSLYPTPSVVCHNVSPGLSCAQRASA
jgi:hypothetical protein